MNGRMARVVRQLVWLVVLVLAGTPVRADAPRAFAPSNQSEDAERTAPEALRESRPEPVRAARTSARHTPATIRPPLTRSLRPCPSVRPDPFGIGLRTRLRC